MMFGGPPGSSLSNTVIGGPGSMPQQNPTPWIAPQDFDDWRDSLRPAEPSAVDRLAALVDEDARERVRKADEALRQWDMIDDVLEQTAEVQKMVQQADKLTRYSDYEYMDAYPLITPVLGGYTEDASLPRYQPPYTYQSHT